MAVTSFSPLSTVMEVDLQIVDTPQQPHWILAQTELTHGINVTLNELCDLPNHVHITPHTNGDEYFSGRVKHISSQTVVK
jgi:hypothetical protein